MTRKVNYQKFQDLNVQILAINADNKFAQKTFAESLKLPYPVLSDHPNLKVIHSYGVVQRLGNPGREFSRRSFFLIDKQGIVRGKWVPSIKDVFPGEPILKAAREIAGKP